MKEVSAAYVWIFIVHLTTHSQCAFGYTDYISIQRQSESNTNNSVVATAVNESVVETIQRNSFIVKLTLNLKDGSVLPYIRDEIFHNSKMYNLTTEDLIDLSDIRSLGFNETLEVFRYLNVSDEIFTVDNFKLLLQFANMSFVEFYEKLKTGPNITAPALLDAMQALNIDASNFSLAIVYGPQDRVYDVLSKGVYTKENWKIAAEKLGTDFDTLFRTVKNIILDQIQTLNLSYYDENLHLILPLLGKKNYDDVWTALNITLVDVYLVPKLRNIIEQLYSRLDQNKILGVTTSPHEITVHRKIFKQIENILKLVNINGVVVVEPEIVYPNLLFTNDKREKFATLWNNNSIAFTIEISEDLVSTNDQNCTYITTNDTRIVENIVKIVNSSDTSLTAEIENAKMFNLGNPLICNGKFVGLATELRENNLFVFDTFYRSTEKVSTSGSHDAKAYPIVFLHMMVLYTLRLIH